MFLEHQIIGVYDLGGSCDWSLE